MCGIIAIASDKDVSPYLYNGLLKLEYRGYDSCGMAVHNSKIHVKKNIGNVKYVNEKEKFSFLRGKVGVAHTRWATHGGVTQRNSHPHLSADERFAVVHNGVITNYLAIKEKLKKSQDILSFTNGYGSIRKPFTVFV